MMFIVVVLRSTTKTLSDKNTESVDMMNLESIPQNWHNMILITLANPLNNKIINTIINNKK